MKSYSAEIEAQLASRLMRRRLAIRFDLPSGSYGFIRGYSGKLTVGGVDYVGSGGLINIELPDASISAAGDEIVVSLASHKLVNGELVQLFDPHLLASIEAEVWFLRPAIIYRFWFDAGRGLEDVEQLHIRQIFSIEHKRSKRGGRRVEGRLLTPAALAKIYEAKRNGPELQHEIDPDDTSYDDIAAAASDPIYWGRRAPEPGTGNP